MKFSYRLKRVCGNVYSNGNLLFTPDGNSVLSPIGNRLSIFDLVAQTTSTLPFENRKDICCMAISHNSRFLISVDVEGHALFINLPRRVVLNRFNFKRHVLSIKFSPDDELFAVTHAQGCQIWRTPSITREFSPLTMTRNVAGHHDETTCLDWSADSNSLIMGSRDLSARVYYRVKSKYMAVSTLSGHRDEIIGCYFSQDGQHAYTVASDGAVFTWFFEVNERSVGNSEDKKTAAKRKRIVDEDTESEDYSSDADEGEEEGTGTATTQRASRWILKEREFLWDPNTYVSCVDFNCKSGLLVVGFTTGVFGLYEMPGCVNVHRLSVSSHSVTSVSINATGEWLAIGSSPLGQLLVWEWKSESYVLKQQGHLYGLNAIDYSSDGQFIASGGEDGKVKIWNALSGFCFITFGEHIAPVTGVKFVGKGLGKAIVSASLDGTVRAHDLLRYKNFRTLTTPDPVQFTSLAVDNSGEVVCAGALDPFQIYVWALQTGRLVDVLSGHEGPIACLDFSAHNSLLASGSWDGTLKLWNVYKNECVETFEHGCDVLAVAFRPDGQEVSCAATNGNLYFWDVEAGAQVGVIEGRRDISGGRLTTDAMTADNAARSKYYTSLAYTADGACVIAAGRSKYTCIYAVSSGNLLKKFQLSYNRSLEGILDELRSDRMVDGINLDNLQAGGGPDGNNNNNTTTSAIVQRMLPGAKASGMGDGSRTTRPEIIAAAVQFSPTGRDWTVVTNQGMQMFSLDDAMLFAPTDIDVAITPQAITRAVSNSEYSLAVNMALHLGELPELALAVESVPIDAITLVVKSIDARMLKDLLKFIAKQITSSQHTEYFLHWCWEVLHAHGEVLFSVLNSMAHLESVRALIRAISAHEKEIMKMGDENMHSLSFLLSQINEKDKEEEEEEEEEEAAAVSVGVSGSGDGEGGVHVDNAAGGATKEEEEEEEDDDDDDDDDDSSSSSDDNSVVDSGARGGGLEKPSPEQQYNQQHEQEATTVAAEKEEEEEEEEDMEEEEEEEEEPEEGLVDLAATELRTPAVSASRKKNKQKQKGSTLGTGNDEDWSAVGLNTAGTVGSVGSVGTVGTFDVSTSAKRRVSFSRPLSEKFLIDPFAAAMTTGTTVSSSSSSKKEKKKQKRVSLGTPLANPNRDVKLSLTDKASGSTSSRKQRTPVASTSSSASSSASASASQQTSGALQTSSSSANSTSSSGGKMKSKSKKRLWAAEED